MIEETQLPKLEAPSRRMIAMATGVALVVAAIVLFVAVLPAEYGIDPLHTGAALGLTALSKASGGAKPEAVAAGIYTSQPKIYKVDSEDMVLHPGQGVEIKYHMQKGAVMVYSWKANGKLMFEFHGEPDQKPNPDYYDSYELDDKVGRDQSYGSFTAPSTGIHGWFWENKGDKNIEFHVTAAGFFDSAKMMAGGSADDLFIEDAK
jgi:hypothetical protein